MISIKIIHKNIKYNLSEKFLYNIKNIINVNIIDSFICIFDDKKK